MIKECELCGVEEDLLELIDKKQVEHYICRDCYDEGKEEDGSIQINTLYFKE